MSASSEAWSTQAAADALRCSAASGRVAAIVGGGLAGLATAVAFAANGFGVLILDADRFVVGAIGISGDTSDKDEMVAIEAVALVSQQLQPQC